MEHNHIDEEIFKQKLQNTFEDFEAAPPLNIWDNIEDALQQEEEASSVKVIPLFRRKKFSRIAAAVAVLFCATTAFLSFHNMDLGETRNNLAMHIIDHKPSSVQGAKTTNNLLAYKADLKVIQKQQANSGKAENEATIAEKQQSQIITLEPKETSFVIPSSDEVKISSIINTPPVNEVLDPSKSSNPKLTDEQISDYKESLRSQYLAENPEQKKSQAHSILTLGLSTGTGFDQAGKNRTTSYLIDVPLKVNINKNYFIQTGVSVINSRSNNDVDVSYNEHKYKGSYEEVVGHYFMSDVNGKDSAVFVKKTVDVYDTELVSKRIKNKTVFSRVEIPALWGFQKDLGKVSLQIKGGPNLGILVSKSQEYDLGEQTNGSHIDLISASHGVEFEKDLYLQLKLATGIGFKYNENISFMLEPQWHYYVDSPYADNNQLSGFDLRVGISYNIK